MEGEWYFVIEVGIFGVVEILLTETGEAEDEVWIDEPLPPHNLTMWD